jgi:hypothetical protein
MLDVGFKSDRLDTNVILEIDREQTEQTFYIYQNNVAERLEELKKREQAKLQAEEERRRAISDSLKRVQQEQAERELAEKEQLRLKEEKRLLRLKRTVSFDGGVETLIRSPKTTFTRTLQRPKSNFDSYLQVTGAANLLNYLGAGLHLRLEMSFLSLFGVAVSMRPVYTALDNDKIGLNFYLGGGFTLHGANDLIGFREGLIGVKLRLGSANSKIDPGVCSIEVQGSLQGIPFINSQNQDQVKTIEALRVGGELGINRWRLHSLAVLYSIDKVFDSNFFIALKFH